MRTSQLHSSGKDYDIVLISFQIRYSFKNTIQSIDEICHTSHFIFFLGLHGGSVHFVDPVITLIVRAYDLGIPSQSSEVPVQIFTSDVSSRSMRFIVAKDPETVGKNYDQIR